MHPCPSAQPRDFHPENIQKLAAHYLHWGDSNLVYKINRTRAALRTPRTDGKPVVMYAHCVCVAGVKPCRGICLPVSDASVRVHARQECGCDRTGEFMAAYAMAWQGKNYAEAATWDESVSGTPLCACRPPPRPVDRIDAEQLTRTRVDCARRTQVMSRHMSYQNQLGAQWFCAWLSDASSIFPGKPSDCQRCDGSPHGRCKAPPPHAEEAIEEIR